MKINNGSLRVCILACIFIISRTIVYFLGLHLNIWALKGGWHFLNPETLRNNLLTGLLYLHSQPPIFNFFIGIILKIGGSHTTFIFSSLLKLISLANSILILKILEKIITTPSWLPLLAALIYLLSPATLIYECELFYTTTISLFLLISVFNIIQLKESGNWLNIFGFIFPLVLLSLTRSLYHIAWLFVIVVCFLYYFRKRFFLKKLAFASLFSLVLAGSWYMKNRIIFGKFTTSTWVGMNLSRSVFHENEQKDSSKVEAFDAFSRIPIYRKFKFISSQYEKKFKGFDDVDLLQLNKVDTIINYNEVSYIPISDLYLNASLKHIKSYPISYAKNVLESSLLYFTSSTIYFKAFVEAQKIKYYDLLFSFNLQHLMHDQTQKRKLMIIMAIPRLAIYLFVFILIIGDSIKNRYISPWNLFIILTIAFAFGVSSLIEHYENMRFRFETEPIFMILAAQAVSLLYSRYRTRRNKDLHELLLDVKGTPLL